MRSVALFPKGEASCDAPCRALVSLFTALVFGASLAAQATPRISSLTLGRTLDPAALEVVEETGVFAPTDTMYAVVRTSGAERVAVTATWMYHGRAGDQTPRLVDRTSETVSLAGAMQSEFHISKRSPWPLGVYSVELRMGDVVQAQMWYIVSQ